MILNSRADLFKVEIPKIFIPDHIKKNYSPYIHRMPTIISDASDLINSSIQAITVPAVAYEPAIQGVASIRRGMDEKHRGSERRFRSSKSANDLSGKEFSITFKLYDGFVNYWIMKQTLEFYYDHNNTNTYTYDIAVRIHDAEGNLMYSIIYTDVLFIGISEFQIAYTDNIQQFKTFECSFSYNEMQFKFEID